MIFYYHLSLYIKPQTLKSFHSIYKELDIVIMIITAELCVNVVYEPICYIIATDKQKPTYTLIKHI